MPVPDPLFPVDVALPLAPGVLVIAGIVPDVELVPVPIAGMVVDVDPADSAGAAVIPGMVVAVDVEVEPVDWVGAAVMPGMVVDVDGEAPSPSVEEWFAVGLVDPDAAIDPIAWFD
jgi:hypothetical protein